MVVRSGRAQAVPQLQRVAVGVQSGRISPFGRRLTPGVDSMLPFNEKQLFGPIGSLLLPSPGLH
jgi:hypothetical protein